MVLSLTNVVLALVPLVGLVFGTMHVYHAREFIEMMLAQPIGRRPLYAALYGGLSLPLAGAYAAGVGLPLLWHGGLSGGAAAGLILWARGWRSRSCSPALAFALALRFEERAVGLGAAIITWLLTVVVYDGLLLLAAVPWGTGRSRPRRWWRPCSIRWTWRRVLLLLQFDLCRPVGLHRRGLRAVLQRKHGAARGLHRVAALDRGAPRTRASAVRAEGLVVHLRIATGDLRWPGRQS